MNDHVTQCEECDSRAIVVILQSYNIIISPADIHGWSSHYAAVQCHCNVLYFTGGLCIVSVTVVLVHSLSV